MLHKLSVEGMPVNVIRTKHNKTTVDIIQEKKNSVYSQNQKGKKEKEKKRMHTFINVMPEVSPKGLGTELNWKNNCPAFMWHSFGP